MSYREDEGRTKYLPKDIKVPFIKKKPWLTTESISIDHYSKYCLHGRPSADVSVEEIRNRNAKLRFSEIFLCTAVSLKVSRNPILQELAAALRE